MIAGERAAARRPFDHPGPGHVDPAKPADVN
jgi:hypothetical protein